MESSAHGSRTFNSFLRDELNGLGVFDQNACRGRQKMEAKRANQSFILEQRAQMRARLVQVAINGSLKFGDAQLVGFAKQSQ